MWKMVYYGSKIQKVSCLVKHEFTLLAQVSSFLHFKRQQQRWCTVSDLHPLLPRLQAQECAPC
jgi:hypothetical protein